MIRKPAAFISTISDERGQELLYAGMPISDIGIVGGGTSGFGTMVPADTSFL
jgi:hypothetical protein